MASKSYRPKADVEEGFTATVNVPAEGGAKAIDIDKWPYETDDPQIQAFLDGHPQVTDRPKKKEER